ncbi:MAG: HEAT repeat domain-containing protein [Thiohalophilus sp.]|uniref:thioredoxin family protein n=1 Tax=Thiohalophilus sp. TaxID=3028392 RepID=UPI00287074B4|nr:thioredoxin family protein [Thiohalophilus sp.]MDR9436349.1 HEAT repeat domain-containing protein [Thiohalophilus sp.]
MTQTPPDAEVLIATGCAHCPTVLQALTDLIKEGLLRELRVSNIVADPGRAQELGVRTTPWARIGPFTLAGNYSPKELRHWAEQAGSEAGIADYIRSHLKEGELQTIETFLRQQPEWLKVIIGLLEQDDLEIQVRLGLDAVLESLAGSDELKQLAPEFARLSENDNAQIRGDATHYLALTGDPDVRPQLEKRLEDDSPDIREIAREGLEQLEQTQT